MKQAKPITHNEAQQWHNSKTAMALLQISACELMHQRQTGKLEFEKRGNAYFYLIPHKVNSAETESK